LTTPEGIRSWWTDDVEFSGDVMRLGFPIAPAPFELRMEETDTSRVAWRSVGAFPPHWAGTTVTWTLSSGENGETNVRFDHDGFATDEGPFASAAYTWGQLIGILKTYAETGAAGPLFTKR
jgi:hypothetical protein